MYRIAGVLTTTSPLHVAAPGNRRVSAKTGGAPDPNEIGIPVTGVQRMELARKMEPVAESTEDAEESDTPRRYVPSSVPCINANTLRGGIRRACAHEVFDTLLARGEQLSLGAYHAMMCGSVTGNPDSRLPSLKEVRQAAKHPFFGLLGGGPRMLRSNYLRVDTALPITDSTFTYVANPVVREEHKVSGRLSQILFFRHVDDTLQFSDTAYGERIINDYLNSVDAWQAQFGGPVDKDSEDKSRGIRTFSAFECVVPGVNFAVGFEVGSSPVQLGMFLKGLRRYALKQSIGGWTRNGFGKFRFQELIIEHDGQRDRVFKPSVKEAPIEQHFELNDTSPIIKEALSAFAEAMTLVTAAEIESLMKPDEKKPKKKNAD